ncbi:replication endonuclease [Shewanella surugensis]|uniref:Replication endonuclease n=1 Tax=Shewanella surugensis TaxID=212020 RepID=A0ABT0LIH6_9GAMM|nr:replication endonuclease [Shewanella surugensis]MCL1127516.1 replication endonuclease [Shewanella surugensis]
MDLSQLSLSAEDLLSALFITEHDKNDLAWARTQLSDVPDHVANHFFKQWVSRRLKYQHSTKSKTSSANIWLRKQVETLRPVLTQFPLPLHLMNTEERRVSVAKEWSSRCATLLNKMTPDKGESVDARELINSVKSPADMWGFTPVLPSFKHYAKRKAAGEFDTDPAMYDAISKIIVRLVDDKWWARKLERAYRQYLEHIAIIIGRVRKGVSPYVSYQCLLDFKARKRAQALWLEQMEVVNEEQELTLTLSEAVKASISNPKNRRVELMVRMRGFEDLAMANGYVGEFYTITAPSSYHAYTVNKKSKAIANKKYKGTNPKQAQKHLTKQWAKARSQLKRDGITPFGFRVVEPHHDGTPHWHLLLFFKPEQLEAGREVLRHYATEHDNDELINNENARFDYKTIDPEKGSATGYIAKYIAKNIDGEYVDDDFEAETSGEHGAQGVAAWASTWNIRQFQQIGGPSVTIWRELRRLDEALEHDEILERARAAADNPNWQRYVEVMGGIECLRADRPIVLAKVVNEAASQYGEDITKIMGVMSKENHTPIHTRLDGWKIRRAPSSTQSTHTDDDKSVKAVAVAFDVSCDLASKSGDSRDPWSTDNNCTPLINQEDTLKVTARKYGIDDFHFDRLQAGATVETNKYIINIKNNQIVRVKKRNIAKTREENGWREGEQLIALQQYHDHVANQGEVDKDLRRQAWDLLTKQQAKQKADPSNANVSINAWLASLAPNLHRRALAQLQEVVDLQAYENSFSKNQPDDTHVDYWADNFEQYHDDTESMYEHF